MKKKNFVTLVLGVVFGSLFSVGMCMCLLPEWNSFTEGVVMTSVGGVGLLILGIYRFISDGKKLVFNWKLIGKIAFGILAALVFGLGMCMTMLWNMMLWGILVGVVGIVLLLCLIPMCFGISK